jgi:hypothetical protein
VSQDQTQGYELATSINDDFEFRVPFTKKYLAMGELRLIGIGMFPVVIGSWVLLGIGPMVLVFISYMAFMIGSFDKWRKGKYASWTWDFFYRIGFAPPAGGGPKGKGWMRFPDPFVKKKKRRVTLGWCHKPDKHPFVGQKDIGDCFVIDTWESTDTQRGSGTLIPPAPLQPVYKRWDIKHAPDKPFPAPVWWRAPDGFSTGANGCEHELRPTIPMTRSLV